ncbi:MAG: hypothetical protein LBD30_07005 [Verrucomicrobiales bacterium]|jgi:predicted peptidase|nr:hypothetical protein [Verrucomicrobiales bacterium]
MARAPRLSEVAADGIHPNSIAVEFSKNLFADGMKPASRGVQFKTPPFTISVGDAKFYVNPEPRLNPKSSDSRLITTTLQFSHPVELRALEKTVTGRESAIARIVGVLRTRQNDRGAFGLWHAEGDVSFCTKP